MRNKIHDALDLLLGQLHVRLELQHNGGRRRFLILLIKAVLRQDDVHASLLDRVNLFDRARQLTLQSLQIIDLVLKLCHTKLAVIKEFKSHVASRQSLGSQIQARAVDALRRDKDRRPLSAFLYLVIHLVLFKLRRDFAGVLCFHVREQGHHVRFGAIDNAAGNNGNEYESCGTDDHVPLPLAVIVPELQVALFHFLNPFASMCLPKSVRASIGHPPCKIQTCMRMIS